MISMKDKLSSVFGASAGIVWWLFTAILFISPVLVLDMPIWADFLVFFVLSIPFIGGLARLALYIITLFYVSDAPDGIALFFWISLGLYVVFELLPCVVSLLLMVLSRKR